MKMGLRAVLGETGSWMRDKQPVSSISGGEGLTGERLPSAVDRSFPTADLKPCFRPVYLIQYKAT